MGTLKLRPYSLELQVLTYPDTTLLSAEARQMSFLEKDLIQLSEGIRDVAHRNGGATRRSLAQASEYLSWLMHHCGAQGKSAHHCIRQHIGGWALAVRRVSARMWEPRIYVSPLHRSCCVKEWGSSFTVLSTEKAIMKKYLARSTYCVFHVIPATDSRVSLPPIPGESCH
jgi:hypothetical protein